MSAPLYIQANMGLGDMLLMNGLVRVLNESFKEIVLPAWAHNVETVRFMFRDLPGVRVEPVDFDGINTFGDNERRLRMGHYAIDGFDVRIFDQEFYRQAGVPFECRWSRFSVQHELADWSDDFGQPFQAFIHDDEARGFPINPELIKTNGGISLKISQQDIGGAKKRNFFAWVPYINRAREVHCINSSFLILCDSLPPVEGQKLFLHHYARPTDYPTLKKNWTILR